MHTEWRIIADSVTGNSHLRRNLPNQDNGGSNLKSTPDPLIGAVSDGHGGREYFRSDRGSAFAIQVAITVLSHYYLQDPAFYSHNHEIICKTIVEEWKQVVLQDILKNPYDFNEQEIIENRKGKRGLYHPEEEQYCKIRPYGATLLATIITDKTITYFQLGDGDILIHSPDGSFIRPIVPDENHLGNETYSLCTIESYKNFKVLQEHILPDFIMLSTDGYANSYQDDSGFISVARDLYSFIHQAETFDAGVQVVQSNLHNWLTITSQKGSGDDITLIILARNPKKNWFTKKKINEGNLLINPVSLEPNR